MGTFTTTAVVKVWTAAGIGPVKTQQVVKAGGKTQLITTSELVAHAVAQGATLAGFQPQEDVRVCLDPAGHPFCLYL